MRSIVLSFVAAVAAPLAAAQVANFDVASGLLTLPSVGVGSDTYTQVSLQHEGNYVFRLLGATRQQPTAPGVATYDLASAMLRIPAVRVGADTYLDVTLRDGGGFSFALAGATPLSAALAEQIRAFLASYDAIWATAVPATGAKTTAFNDGCYLHDGRTNAYLVAEVDGDPAAHAASEAFQIGVQRTNVQVLAVRELRNADGSDRREVDLQYDIVYRDGSRRTGNQQTLISGSSAGSARCSSPTVSSALRFYGNQHLLGAVLRPRNQRDERYAVSTGTALSPAVQYRRDFRFTVTDPLGVATYVVITGPGPGGEGGAASDAFAVKLLSPRIMRSAPEMGGRTGNFTNWGDDDVFRICGVSGGGMPLAHLANCTGVGAPGDNVGWTTSTQDATADAGFAAQGWRAGASYRVDVYADDGWKTVNGQAGRTPIATYYTTLARLPYSFVEMAAADRYPRLSAGALTSQGVRANAVSATPSPLQLSWSAPAAPADARAFRVSQGWSYIQGSRTGNATGAVWPQLRFVDFIYPATTARSGAFRVRARPADMANHTYFEYMLYMSDRNDSVIQSRLSFQ